MNKPLKICQTCGNHVAKIITSKGINLCVTCYTDDFFEECEKVFNIQAGDSSRPTASAPVRTDPLLDGVVGRSATFD